MLGKGKDRVVADMDKPGYWEMLIRRGATRFFLLATLNERPMHGYEIAKAMRAACAGCCDPSDAMIYPALHDLQEGGYIDCEVEATGNRERKVCHLTERGHAAYRAAAEAWMRIMPPLARAVKAASVAGNRKCSC